MKAFAVTSTVSLGATFLEWSVHYLSGESTYFDSETGTSIPLVEDPVGKQNSHGHQKNHPEGFENVKQCFDNLYSQESNDLVSCYFLGNGIPKTISELGLGNLKTLSIEETDKINLKRLEDKIKIYGYLKDAGIKILHLGMSNIAPAYNSLTSRNVTRKLITNEEVDTLEALVDYQKVFFSESLKKYEKLEPWDVRELIALNFNYISVLKEEAVLLSDIDTFKSNHLFVLCDELWFNGETALLNVLDYLNLKVVDERLSHWRNVYRNWQEAQRQRIQFAIYLPHIVESIVNNYFFDLKRFELTLPQEAIIQNHLIRNYNLTIKNWRLEKFPDNTQDVHLLLEENFHKITNI